MTQEEENIASLLNSTDVDSINLGLVLLFNSKDLTTEQKSDTFYQAAPIMFGNVGEGTCQIKYNSPQPVKLKGLILIKHYQSDFVSKKSVKFKFESSIKLQPHERLFGRSKLYELDPKVPSYLRFSTKIGAMSHTKCEGDLWECIPLVDVKSCEFSS